MGIIFKHSLSSLKPTKYKNHVVKVCHNPGYGLQHLRLSTLKGGRKHQGCLPLCQHWLPMFPNNPWSYEACATPLPGYVAPVPVAPQAPLASFTSGAGYGGFNGNFGVVNTGTLQPYGQYLPKSANRASGSSSDSVKF